MAFDMEKFKECINNIAGHSIMCRACGKKIEGARCPSCNRVYVSRAVAIQTLEQQLNELSTTIDSLSFLDKVHIFSLLLRIKDYNITCVNNFLYSQKGIAFITTFLSNILSKNDTLSSDELTALEYISMSKIDSHIVLLFRIVVKRALLNLSNVCHKTFKIIIKHYLAYIIEKMTTKRSTVNFNIKIPTYSISRNAKSSCHIRLLDEESINLYFESDISLLITLYHELFHSLFRYKSDNFELDLTDSTLTMVKDRYLTNNLTHYYDDNYDLLAEEIVAELYGVNCTIDLMNLLKISPPRELIDYRGELQSRLAESLKSSNRLFLGEQHTLDEIFKIAIEDDMQALKYYPLLGSFYKVVDGVVVLKDDDELQVEQEKMLSKANSPANAGEIEKVFQRYINKHNKLE